jgi:Protein of unknown function (DUF2752)
MHASERRLGLLLVAGGCLPFAAGALVGEDGTGLPACPLRALTGLPCPLCGATRAFALAARGDARVWQFNAAWVLLAAAAVLAGALALLASARGAAPLTAARDALATRLITPARVTAFIALVFALPWAYALVQRGPIAGA